jgi:hypothetical protein
MWRWVEGCCSGERGEVVSCERWGGDAFDFGCGGYGAMVVGAGRCLFGFRGSGKGGVNVALKGALTGVLKE